MSVPLRDAIKLAQIRLKAANIENYQADAKLIYCFQAGLDKLGLLMHWDDILADNQFEAYMNLVDRRAEREPLQHIIGEQEFYGNKFNVSPQVLIPRMETEELVEQVLNIINHGKIQDETYVEGKNKISHLLDLCTGSGAIGITIGKACPKLKITGVDISEEALEISKLNAKLNGVKNISFIKSNMFHGLKGKFSNKKFDLICSNPPYIKTKVIETLEPEVKDFEPMMALDGGEDGLDFYRIIAKEASNHLNKNGILAMEIGHDQREKIFDILENEGAWKNLVGLSDLSERDRMIFATLK